MLKLKILIFRIELKFTPIFKLKQYGLPTKAMNTMKFIFLSTF